LGGEEVKKKRPVLLIAIAILQAIPIVVLPPKLFLSINRLFFLPVLAVFAVLAWALLTFRAAGRTLTIFVQGFNIIVRTLITLARVVPSRAPGTPADVPLLVSSLLSVGLSVVILLYVDQPELQLLFES
jgi:hypothetical protein